MCEEYKAYLKLNYKTSGAGRVGFGIALDDNVWEELIEVGTKSLSGTKKVQIARICRHFQAGAEFFFKDTFNEIFEIKRATDSYVFFASGDRAALQAAQRDSEPVVSVSLGKVPMRLTRCQRYLSEALCVHN